MYKFLFAPDYPVKPDITEIKSQELGCLELSYFRVSAHDILGFRIFPKF